MVDAEAWQLPAARWHEARAAECVRAAEHTTSTSHWQGAMVHRAFHESCAAILRAEARGEVVRDA